MFFEAGKGLGCVRGNVTSAPNGGAGSTGELLLEALPFPAARQAADAHFLGSPSATPFPLRFALIRGSGSISALGKVSRTAFHGTSCGDTVNSVFAIRTAEEALFQAFRKLPML